MKKTIKLINALLLVLLITTYSCDKEEEIIITLEDLVVSIDENPTNGLVIGTITSDSNSTLTFSIDSQSPNGALAINTDSGELTVADPLLFDFETNPTITATISADEANNDATVTITLNNVNELNTQDFTATIDENPTNGQSIGTLQAIGDGTLSYSITSQSPTGAMSVNTSTGELTVADATLFDFETNPTITADIAVDNSGNIQSTTATITLNNVNELSIQDFSTTIDENPANGQSIGTVQASGDGTLSYSITSQSPANALNIDSSTGELTVANATLFDFETNPTITANISVSNSGSTQTATATINLNNVNELSIQNFMVSSYENPTNAQSLGTVQASGDGTLSYSITSQSAAGALSINANTGELTIADNTLFDFETNPTITATVSVSNSGNTQTATATINLIDAHEVGEFKFGGVIFWIDPTSNNSSGLVCAIQNSTQAVWGCSGTVSGATGTAIGTGETNTQAIMASGCASGSAAEYVTNLNLNGYNDWFLPSVDEFSEIVANYSAYIWPTIQANGGSALFSTCWTSTEHNSNNAYIGFIGGSTPIATIKNLDKHILPVRSWTDF